MYACTSLVCRQSPCCDVEARTRTPPTAGRRCSCLEYLWTIIFSTDFFGVRLPLKPRQATMCYVSFKTKSLSHRGKTTEQSYLFSQLPWETRIDCTLRLHHEYMHGQIARSPLLPLPPSARKLSTLVGVREVRDGDAQIRCAPEMIGDGNARSMQDLERPFLP